MFEMRFDRTDTETVGCLKTPGDTSANGAAVFCREAMLVFMGQHSVFSSMGSRIHTSSSSAITQRENSSSFPGPRNKWRIGALAVEWWQSLHTDGKTRPNPSFQRTQTARCTIFWYEFKSIGSHHG